MSSPTNFKKGSVEMLLLHVLHTKGDCYGYQLSQLIRDTSGGVLDFPVGSLYPALYRLIDHGHISDYKKLVGKRLTRVYYHIEKSGIERLTALKNDYFATNQSIRQVLDFDFGAPETESEENGENE